MEWILVVLSVAMLVVSVAASLWGGLFFLRRCDAEKAESARVFRQQVETLRLGWSRDLDARETILEQREQWLKTLVSESLRSERGACERGNQALSRIVSDLTSCERRRSPANCAAGSVSPAVDIANLDGIENAVDRLTRYAARPSSSEASGRAPERTMVADYSRGNPEVPLWEGN